MRLIVIPQRRDLLSLGAARALAEADHVASDPTADPDLLALARRDAPRRTLAEAEAPVLAALAAAGDQAAVVAGPAAIGRLAADLKALGAHYAVLEPAPEA